VARAGGSCREQYGECLALEFQEPAVFGAVHHVTVLCYNLQHPRDFSPKALAWMRSSLRAVIEGNVSPVALREQAGREFKRQARVLRKDGQATPPARTHWSRTVLDVRRESPAVYTGDILAWARAILQDLG
jgi:hypothetical protein